MTVEIERRFLLKNDSWRAKAGAPQTLRQGYLSVEKECTIRVRIIGNRAWLTLKGYISDVSRSEFEYEIPLAHAETMMATMCPFKLEKHRYEIEHEGFVFEIDEYFGDNAPLVVVEEYRGKEKAMTTSLLFTPTIFSNISPAPKPDTTWTLLNI